MSQADVYATPAAAAALPSASPIQAADASVRGAIARASQATGVDFSYLMAQARLESSLNPGAHAATSSAAGLYQFTKGTWSSMLARYGGAMGLGSGAAAGGAAVATPASRAQLMALRYDPSTAAMMAAELAGDNTAALTGVLGHAPNASQLYLAHFLGLAGATSFLSALAADPTQSAAALLPKAAAANRTVFFDASGAPRSLGGVMALLDSRMAVALDQAAPAANGTDGWSQGSGFDPYTTTAPAVPPPEMGPMAQQYTATQADDTPPDTTSPTTTSMAETLLHTFALTGDGAGSAPAMVRTAYGQMQAWGL